MSRSEKRARRSPLLLVVSGLGVALALGLVGPAGAGVPPTTDTSSTTTPTTAPTSTTATTATTTTTVPAPTTTAARQTTTTRRTTPTTKRAATTTTTIAVSTSVDVLVPGDGTKGAESTTTTTIQTATKISREDGSDRMLIAAVIGGLLVLAAGVGVLTWRYWVATRPPLSSE